MKPALKSVMLSLMLLVTSCNTLPSPTPTQPKPQVPKNLIQIDFTGVDGSTPTSQIRQVGEEASFSKQGLTEVSGLTFKALRTETHTLNGGRYLQATYEVTNNTGSTLSDLSFVPVVLSDTDGNSANNNSTVTLSGTEFKNIKLFDGTDASNWATSLIPTYAMDYNRSTNTYSRSTSPSTFKDFIYVDEYDITDPSGLEITETKPYGWKVQDPIPNGGIGTVTFSVFLPTTSPNKQNPYSFSVMAAYTEGVPDSNFDTTMSLNVNPTATTDYPPRSAVGPTGTPFVAWVEDTNVYVKEWNGEGWTLLGSPASTINSAYLGFVDIQVGSDNRPVILVSDRNTLTQTVLKWNGTSWVTFGDVLNVGSVTVDPSPLLLNSTGQPMVTVMDGQHTHVKQWNGTTWEQLGGQVDDTSNVDTSAALGMGANNLPVVVVSESNDSTNTYQVRVKKWNGTDWTTLSSSLNLSPSVQVFWKDLVVDGTNVYVTWQESAKIYASKWDGTNWTLLGGGPLSDSGLPSSQPSIAVGPTGVPYVAYRQSGSITLKSFDGSNWNSQTLASGLTGNTPQVMFSGDNSVLSWVDSGQLKVRMDLTHQLLGEALNVTSGKDADEQTRSAVGPTGTPFVAWVEDTNVYVKEWNGAGWTLLGNPASTITSTFLGFVDLQVGSDNRPVILVSDRITLTQTTLKWNGTGWVTFGSTLTAGAVPSIPSPVLLNSTGQPIVTVTESNHTYVRKWSGTTWEQLGGQVDDTTYSDHSTVLGMGSDKMPIVVISESDDGTNTYQLRVKKWSGSAWTTLSSSLNMDPAVSVTWKDLAVDGAKVYVTWQENNKIYARKWDGTSWTLLGDAALSDTSLLSRYPSTALSPSGVPYVAYVQAGKVTLKSFDGSSWSKVDRTFSMGGTGQHPRVRFNGDDPVVSWVESGDLYVKR